MSKTIEIQEVLRCMERMFEMNNSPVIVLGELEGWLKSKLWEPKIGEICEFSDDKNFPDDKTVVGYFVRKKNAEAWYSKHKHMPSISQLPYPYVRPIKGGGE
jgi:hypothetical protein